jgi:hypothetical protein
MTLSFEFRTKYFRHPKPSARLEQLSPSILACTTDVYRARHAQRLYRILLVIHVVVCASFLVAGQNSSAPIVIRAARLFDPTSGRMVDHPVVVISGDKVQTVSEGDSPAIQGAAVINLGNATLLPGFIDVHTHLTMNTGGGGYDGLGISAPRAALIGAKNARLTLMAGFTTVRNVGAQGYSDVALRDAINVGDAIGSHAGFRSTRRHYRRTL